MGLEKYLNKITCGDSVNIIPEIFKQKREKEIVIITDPPFNVGYHYETYKDNMPEDDYLNLLSFILGFTHKCVLIHYPEMLYKISYEIGMFPERVVSWVYNSNTSRQHRDIAFFGINPDFNKVKQPYKNLNDKRIKERIEQGKDGCKLYDWWEVNQIKNVNKEKWDHPCQMPLLIMERIIKLLPEDIIVLDPFCGTGTTCVAAKSLGRDYIGIDIDNKYCNIAAERLNGVDAHGQISYFLR